MYLYILRSRITELTRVQTPLIQTTGFTYTKLWHETIAFDETDTRLGTPGDER